MLTVATSLTANMHLQILTDNQMPKNAQRDNNHHSNGVNGYVDNAGNS